MPGFDKKAVLEVILKEAPVLTNLRKKITVRGRRRVIYAYYHPRGQPDAELKYDRLKNPINTTPSSTLCEIYSVWDEGEENKDTYRGPRFYDGCHPSREARAGRSYDFGDSASNFSEHFNQICKRLGYDFEFTGEHVEIKKEAELKIGKRVVSGEIIIDEHIGIDLGSKDPSISVVLDLIGKVYERVKKKRLPQSFMFVRKK